jgi:hypothetical protein
MTEVDWLLDQFALALEQRDAEIAALRAGPVAHPQVTAPPKDEQDPQVDDGTDRPEDEEQSHA